MTERITKRLRVYGIVQGVGFRPTVSRHAMETGVTGTVCNKGPYVEIFVQGTQTQVEAFQTALETRPPRRAAILKIDAKPAPDVPEFPTFEIIESAKTMLDWVLMAAADGSVNLRIRRIAAICIRLSTAPAADRALPFWTRCRMTASAQA